MGRSLTLATAAGRLAVARAESVARDLSAAWPDLEVRVAEVGGHTSVEEVRQAVRSGRASVAVHAFKDLPVGAEAGLSVPVVPQRADPRDVLVSRTNKVFTYLPEAARVGANGARRKAQLLRRRSDLQVLPLHGDLDTRLGMLDRGEYDAIVLAAADLWHLGRLDDATEYFDTDLMIPAPAQGALAMEIRQSDARTAKLLAPLNDESSAYAVRAERACLARLGGSGDAPIGIFATTDGDDMFIHGIVALPDGSRAARLRWSGPWREASDVGTTLAELLVAIGARDILAGRPIPPTTRYAARRARDDDWHQPYPEEEA